MQKIKDFLTGDRMKSLYWRVGGVVVVGVLGVLVEPEVATSLNLPTVVTLMLGLVLNEVTKFLNPRSV